MGGVWSIKTPLCAGISARIMLFTPTVCSMWWVDLNSPSSTNPTNTKPIFLGIYDKYALYLVERPF